MEYYDQDPTIPNELDRLIDCYKFKIQFEIYGECLRERQLSNLHLTVIFEQVTTDMVRYINRLTDSDLVLKKINSLLICHAFSGFFQIFQRMAFISQEELKKVVQAMNQTPKLTKKVALFFVFMQMCEQENQMISSQNEVSKKYEYLITFTRNLLIF